MALIPVRPKGDLDVDALPRRVAHVAHALMAASDPMAFGIGPLKVSEIMIYDGESLSPAATNSALLRAMRKHRLVDRVGYGLYIPSIIALDNRAALEERYLRDTDEP